MNTTPVRAPEFQCPACKAWARSPFHFGSVEGFESMRMVGNTMRCPSCGAVVPFGKENLRFVRSDGRGGWVGADIT